MGGEVPCWSQRLVARVTERCVVGLLAGAEPAFAGFGCRPFDGFEFGFGLVAAVAEGLVFGQATGAPPVVLVLFHLYRDWLAAGYCTFCQVNLLFLSNYSCIAVCERMHTGTVSCKVSERTMCVVAFL